MSTLTSGPRHGTKYHYDLGCRCHDCNEARRQARKRARDKARAEGRASYERELAASRALKRSCAGTCEGCGGPTRYNGRTVKGPSLVCADCRKAMEVQRGAQRRGTVGKTAAVLVFLRRPRRFSEIRDRFGISNGYTGSLLARLKGYGLVQQVQRGVWVATEDAS